MRRPQTAGGSSSPSSPPHFQPGELAKSHPLLVAALANSKWEDGTPKKAGELLIHCYSKVLYATLRLKGTGYQLQVEVPELLLVNDAVEAALALETPPWEENLYDKAVAPKKGKGT